MIDQKFNSSFGQMLLVFVLLLLFTGCLVNLEGGDWDGVQIALGSIFFDAASQGHILKYRFEMQPLTFGIVRLTYLLTRSHTTLFYLPALLGSLGMTIYLAAMKKVSGSRLSVLFLLGILLLMPEFIFGSIYLNSTVFGLPFAAAAMWLASEEWTSSKKSRTVGMKIFFIGVCLALASLCRFDFLLLYPMFLFFFLRAGLSHLLRKVFAFTIGSAVVFVPAFLVGMFNPAALSKMLFEHQATVDAGGHFYETPIVKLSLSMIGINMFVWVLAAVAAGYSLYTIIHNRRWLDLLVLGPLVILLYPAAWITTPKYLVPFYMFVGLFVTWFLTRIVIIRKPLYSVCSVLLAVCVMIACFLPVRLRTARSGKSFVQLTSSTWRPTHDGPRSFWGYCSAIREMTKEHRPPDWLVQHLRKPGNLLLVAPYDGWIAGDRSQEYLLCLVKNCGNLKVGPEGVFGKLRSRRIVMTDPKFLQKNLEKYFSSVGITASQAVIPLGVNNMEADVLRHMFAGALTISKLFEEIKTDKNTLVKTIAVLRKKGLIERTGVDQYKLNYHFYEIESDMNKSKE